MAFDDFKCQSEESMEYGLIGMPLEHSYSPEIHRRLFGYDYRLCPLREAELPDFFGRREFRGINITIPYKKAVMPYCGELGETAKRAGSVNTIIRRADGTLFGDNTDLAGFHYLLRRAGISLAGKRVVILGSGGSSLTVRLAASDAKALSVTTVTRRGDINYGNVYDQCANAQIIVNATPVGMYPHAAETALELSRFPSLEAAADLIYNPLRTRFLQQAEALGLRCSNGLSMLVAQASAAGALFGRRPTADIESVCSDLERALTNWVLIGMPGCGKTGLGEYLARESGREFVDLDAVIERRAGMTIPEIFAAKGEEAFREMESALALEYGARTGLVIAAGGGTVLREENALALRQNGRVLWIQRDSAMLARAGRPLSSGADLSQMEKARRPFYQAAADGTVIHTENWNLLNQQALRFFQKKEARAFQIIEN
ncbi:MAG: shikimate kinase [Oscillospiraceae bacterium]|nr:shikimate kinase [Oscillospiraceae bacterium]